jgi:hypothetical protein
MDYMTAQTNEHTDSRNLTDRRNRSFKSFIFSLHNGRRIKARRKQDAAKPYYTDIYEFWGGLNVITIVCLSALDSFLTLQILERGGIEINPVMQSLLEINNSAFIIGKMAITSICLIFVLIHINFKLLRLFPTRSLLLTLTSLYVLLIGYELMLLSTI